MCVDCNPDSISFKKAQLRKETLARIKKFERKSEESTLISSFLNSLDIYKNAQLILAFRPMRTEPDLVDVLDDRVAFPYIENGRMLFSKSRIFKKTSMGFLEPEHIPLEFDSALLIAPLVAFDSNRFRLGRGGGFYDRFISENKEKLTTIGVGFSISFVDSVYPESHDRMLDHIISVENNKAVII